MTKSQPKIILVTGATGYIGGRLVPDLLKEGYHVRCLVRDVSRLRGRAWLSDVTVFEGDVLRPETLAPAFEGADVAYYMIHSMKSHADFQEKDMIAAQNFSAAAREAGTSRIIYLGGLSDPNRKLSKHLASRQETGVALRSNGVPVTEFQAAVIIGSGSLSFEMIRYLTERVPLMVCPKWVYTRTQPIGIRNVLSYLVQALNVEASTGQIIEIGGADVITYAEMIHGYAAERGLRRILLPVPVLTPRLSSHWVHWVTPISAEIAKPLILGLENELIVKDDWARQLFPDIEPMDFRTAMRRAVEHLQLGRVETIWNDALISSQDSIPTRLSTQDGMIIEQRQIIVHASAEQVFKTYSGLGGERGWYYFDWAWQLRGLIDRAIGGVGLRRGRRVADDVRIGDALDFWRVEAVSQNKLLRLRAEMKVPGLAWLQFESIAQTEVLTELRQTAYFAPKGLFGLLYWYLLYPLHKRIFSGLVRALAWQAEDSERNHLVSVRIAQEQSRHTTIFGALITLFAGGVLLSRLGKLWKRGTVRWDRLLK